MDISTVLKFLFVRGDHIVPNFEEIWPSKKTEEKLSAKGEKPVDWEYYKDAMENGPQLSGTVF